MSVKSAVAEIDSTGWLILAIVAVVVIYEASQNLPSLTPGSSLATALGIPDPNDTTGDPNSLGDTSSAAYAGGGILGWLGNVFNKGSGGIFQSLGASLGSTAEATWSGDDGY